MTNSDKLTPLSNLKDRVLGRVGTERRDNYERDRIKSLFNWGELSRMLAGTRAVVLKNKYPKKHDAFIQDLTESTRQVLVRHGHLPAAPEQPESEFYAESFTD